MAIRSVAVPTIAEDVHRGLTATSKSLPPKLFYDAIGSELFEEITRLPEYYLTRTELAILEARARQVARLSPPGASIIELGAGSSAKTRVLLQALACPPGSVPPHANEFPRVSYYPVDISRSALADARSALSRELPYVRITPTVADLGGDLHFLRDIPAPRVVLYIGSSIGNMEQDEALAFLRRLHSRLDRGDALLLGTDLVKDRATLLAAYNDVAGVTARFNLNLLARINRELAGHFDLQAFRHQAIWNPQKRRIEIYIESRRDQLVPIDALSLRVQFARGERIHTENSHKYTLRGARDMLRAAGFTPLRTWTDDNEWFAVHWAKAS